jgi:hypothetical protein
MQQATAVFANAAARTAAITSPVEGQMTYLEDTNQYASWDGSSWVSPFGMTLLNKTDFTAAATLSVDNVFSSAYDNYKILISITSASVDGTDHRLRMRVGGVDLTTSNYKNGYMFFGSTNATALQASTNRTDAFLNLGNPSNTLGGGIEATLYKPFLTTNTQIVSLSGGTLNFQGGGIVNNSTSYDGFTFFPLSGNTTGTLRVYGLRN